MRSRTDKAESRAQAYRRAIAQHHAAGSDREALAEALRWLRSEAAHLERHRPRDAARLYRQLTERISALAQAIPNFRPTPTPDGNGRHHQ